MTGFKYDNIVCMDTLNAFNLLFTRNIPDGLRFRSFGTPHIAYLLAAALLAFIMAMRAKHLDAARKEKSLKFFAWALPIIYLSRFTVFILLDTFVEPQMSLLDRLPFHLCALNAIIIPLAVSKNSKTLFNYMYCISLPGAAAAMLTPAMSYYGQYFFISWQIVFFYLDHTVMTLVPVLAVAYGKFRPDYRRLPHVAAIIVPYTIAVYFADKLLNENWLFLNYPDEGTIIALFAVYFGNPGYLAAMFALAFAVIFLLYLPWIIDGKIIRHGQNK